MIPQLFALSAIAFSTVAAQDSSDLITKLMEAPTVVARTNLLPDEAFKFDFVNNQAGRTAGGGGFSSSANVLTMPATIGNDVSITAGFLGPCAMNTPHTHPRSAEFNYVTNGSLVTGMIPENGGKFVFNEVKENQATLFPQSAIHFEYNDHCEPVTFVAFFSDSYPGVTQVAQRFFGLPADVVAASLNIDSSEVQKISGLIPDNIAMALEECTKRCGLGRTGQPNEQHQNGPPSNSTSSNNTNTNNKNSNNTSTNNTLTNSGINNTDTNLSNNGGVSGNLESGGNDQNKGLIIGLIAAVGVMGLGYIVLAAIALFRRRKSGKGAARGYVRAGESFAPGGMYDSEKYELQSEHLRTPYDPPSGSH